MKILRYGIALLFTTLLYFSLSRSINAQNSVCTSFSLNPQTVRQNQDVSLNFSQGLRDGEVLTATIQGTTKRIAIDCNETSCNPPITTLGSFSTSDLTVGQNYSVQIVYSPASATNNQICNLSFNYTTSTRQFCTNVGLTSVTPTNGFQNTTFIFSGCAGDGGNPDNPCTGTNARVAIMSGRLEVASIPINNGSGNSCDENGNFTVLTTNLPFGPLTAQVTRNMSGVGRAINFNVDVRSQDQEGETCTIENTCSGPQGQPGTQTCTGTFQRQNSTLQCATTTCSVCEYPGDGTCSAEDIRNGNPECNQLSPTPIPDNGVSFQVQPCSTIDPMVWRRAGESGPPPSNGIATAIGCLPTEPGALIKMLIVIAIGFGGGIAFLLILFGGLRIILSRSEPKVLQESQELISSAIVGLLLIILSIFILRVVGFDILRIPGFAG